MFYSTAKDIWAGYCGAENYLESESVEIGCDVWIGARSIVLDGVRIGDGAIVAAGSVVTENVDPYAIVGGVPAKLIRRRFSPEVEMKLVNEAWWDLSDEDLKRAVQLGKFSMEIE
ncbi:CatB-related O-acetyltransferase [Cupriavidus sp. KK10]|jgi:acetyltransferase-like isoleucine patch superfamily enzyme|uniref:CatB-related O-acetyltransferase n=1 Tax=Cupriavidus sp. KK10 TaxID=1478019 RepID=UPI001BA4F7E7|nr:CatB-related O-acetyltransferase [Cupriavidus sp. KK10]QUN30592.1 CatB-related O-acetyltransferase [Cupriavidus sp. KK10]